jgi:hypothetical protein
MKFIRNCTISLLFILCGLYGFTKISASSIPQIEDKTLIVDKSLNLEIENYIDKYLSEIIRIRNYSPDQVRKVVCVHRTAYVERAVTAPNMIRSYVKLNCADATQLVNGKLSNLTALPARLYLQRYQKKGNPQTLFKIVGDDTPRGELFYLEDIRSFLSNDMMDKVNAIQFSQSDNELLKKKQLDYQRKPKTDCK